MTPRHETRRSNHDDNMVVVDDADEEEDRGSRPNSSNNNNNKQQKGNKKPKLFQESGLTDSERRMIRQNQRTIQATLRNHEIQEYEEIEQIREKNNHVFQTSVCFTREVVNTFWCLLDCQCTSKTNNMKLTHTHVSPRLFLFIYFNTAVLDADNVDMITMKYAKQMEKEVQVPRFDAMKLVQKLQQKCSIGGTSTSSGNGRSSSNMIDWKFLGKESGICYNAVPDRVVFLAGVLDHQITIKTRTVRQARVAKDTSIRNVAEMKPESMNNQNNKGDADKLSAMEKAMRVIRKKLQARSEEEKQARNDTDIDSTPEIDMVQFLFNPQSFTQTVENIFNFSFLIKKGEAGIGIEPPLARTTPTGAYVMSRIFKHTDGESTDIQQGNTEHDDPNKSTSTQAVCPFTMADWRRLCAKQAAANPEGFVQGDLPHRSGSRRLST